MDELYYLEKAEAEAYRKFREHTNNDRLAFVWLEANNAVLSYKRKHPVVG